ncbi:MAG: OsmC family protein, partial [Anaerolineaceae bacterium]|nr:OsmC family protein [Anaerolineaceae bacterium]
EKKLGNATIKWLPGGLTFIGTDSTKHSVVLAPQSEGTGMKPSELLLVAVGACTAVDVVGILEKKRTPLSSLEIEVSGEQDADPPWTFRKVHIHYKVKGNGLRENSVKQAISLSEEKYCSVSSTIKGTAKITTSFEILTD